MKWTCSKVFAASVRRPVGAMVEILLVMVKQFNKSYLPEVSSAMQPNICQLLFITVFAKYAIFQNFGKIYFSVGLLFFLPPVS